MTIAVADLGCVFANVVVFCVFQCVFFFFVASRQYEQLVANKIEVLDPFLRSDRPGRQTACARLLAMIGDEERQISDRINREEVRMHNLRTLATYAVPYISAFVLATVAAVVHAVRRGTWKGHHSLACLLLVFCFTTEIFYYFGVVRTYQVLGDWEMLDRVYSAATRSAD